MLSIIGFALALTFTNILHVSTTKTDELKIYIVHLDPLEGQEFSQPHKLEEWYNSFLLKIVSGSNEKPTMIYAYHHVITGFAAKMSVEQAKAMENTNGVMSVTPEGVFQLHTTHSPQFLGLCHNSGLWKDSNYGKGIIIGLIDSGTTPGHPSFDDKGVPPPPTRWKGKCDVDGCNNKLIGMRNFLEGSLAVDVDGHGTHTSSTAAGNSVDNANVFGQANGTATGMAPLAHVAMYKVCEGRLCYGSAIVAGMDAAVGDGVDVLSISLGSFSSPFYNDIVAVGAFGAIRNGIFVSCSAGNGGPSRGSLSNEAPWILTVGASTTDRRIMATVKLGNKKLFDGESLYQPTDFHQKFMPLVYPGENGDYNAARCTIGSLDGINVKGKVVLCDTGGMIGSVQKGEVVRDAGGTAMILANDVPYGETVFAQAHVLPASHVGYKEGVEIKKYLKSTTSPVATIVFHGTVFNVKSAPEVGYFSSRGPNNASPGILKPDIIGPGINILAAWHESVENKTGTKATFNVISGTSMSCPHLAGIAALLKSAHPEWSPAAIKSAIMTTASQLSLNGHAIVDERDLPADVFTIGAGHVNPPKANKPGLVFDIQPDDYIPYLCGLNYTTKQIGVIVKKTVSCTKTIPEAQLNYPNFAIKLNRGESKTYSRTVTNVGTANSTYTIGDVSLPKGVRLVVGSRTDELSFTALGQKLTYELTFTWDSNVEVTDQYAEGYMTWVSGKYSVRTPFSFNFT